MIFTLMTSTPHRLRYLAVTENNPVGVDSGIIPNAAGLTPDLRTDSVIFREFPMNNLVSTLVANVTQARRLLLGDPNPLAVQVNFKRAHTVATPRNSQAALAAAAAWSVDANEGVAGGSPASADHAIFIIAGPGVAGAEAYIDCSFQHSLDR